MSDDQTNDDAEAGGGIDFGGLLAQAQAMQQQLMEAQAAVAEQEVEGQAGGGVVKVRCTGGLEFLDVTISPEAVDPNDVEMLQDLVLAAVRDAVARANSLNQQAMGSLGGLAGGLGGLGGLLP
ncbi:MAG TPA: YbaB/EbfC family nucleoid-associated protein [Acidimicrobiales bacterium]|nr:YbaB/EbfC family nucleoid-associated protein [Acidimicrobiales bacterium]